MAKVNSSKSGLLKRLGLKAVNPGVFCGEWRGSGKRLESRSPIDGSLIASVVTASEKDYEPLIRTAQKSLQQWQALPAPRRGEVVRQLGDALRGLKSDLGNLVTWEAGKIV